MHTSHPRMPGELSFMLICVLFSLFMLWASYQISGIAMSSPGSFPMLCAGIMLLTGLFNALKTWRARMALDPGQSLVQQFIKKMAPPQLVMFTALILAYMVLLEVLGFLLSSYLFLLASMQLLGSKRFGLNLAVSAVCLVAIFIVFQTAFSVVLPSGSLIGPYTPEFLK